MNRKMNPISKNGFVNGKHNSIVVVGAKLTHGFVR